MGNRSTNKTVYSAKYHLIWCPKYRRRVPDGPVGAPVVAEADAEMIEVEVMTDRGHLLVEVPPVATLSKLVQNLKGRSSRLLRTDFPPLRRLPALWSPSWSSSTTGGAPLEVVWRYDEDHKAAA